MIISPGDRSSSTLSALLSVFTLCLLANRAQAALPPPNSKHSASAAVAGMSSPVLLAAEESSNVLTHSALNARRYPNHPVPASLPSPAPPSYQIKRAWANTTEPFYLSMIPASGQANSAWWNATTLFELRNEQLIFKDADNSSWYLGRGSFAGGLWVDGFDNRTTDNWSISSNGSVSASGNPYFWQIQSVPPGSSPQWWASQTDEIVTLHDSEEQDQWQYARLVANWGNKSLAEEPWTLRPGWACHTDYVGQFSLTAIAENSTTYEGAGYSFVAHGDVLTLKHGRIIDPLRGDFTPANYNGSSTAHWKLCDGNQLRWKDEARFTLQPPANQSNSTTKDWTFVSGISSQNLPKGSQKIRYYANWVDEDHSGLL